MDVYCMAQNVLLISKCWIQSRTMASDCAWVLFGHHQLIFWQLRQMSCRCQLEETNWHFSIYLKLLHARRTQCIIYFFNLNMVAFFETKPRSIITATFGIRYQDAVKDLNYILKTAKFQFPGYSFQKIHPGR